jgi:electron transfer flavoprotein alpha subunit
MRIITCIKYVPETVEKNLDGTTVKRENVSGKINPADMFAIEESVRIKERINAEAIGLCMGVAEAKTALRQAVAIGLDSVYLMTDKRFAGSDTYATSYILSCGIKHIGKYDMILCGKQSTDGDTGQVAQEIASHLDIPCLINVVNISVEKESVICSVLTEDGYVNVETCFPVVISVLKGINEPRVPTIKGLQRGSTTKFSVLDAGNILIDISKCGLHGSPTRVKTVRRNTQVLKTPKDISDNYVSVIGDLLNNAALSKKSLSKTKELVVNTVEHNPLPSQEEFWVVCQVCSGELSEISLQLLTKAEKICRGTHTLCAVVLESTQKEPGNLLSRYGVKKIYYASHYETDCVFDETQANALLSLCEAYKPFVVLLGSTTWGRWIAPFVASKLETGLTADCMGLELDPKSGILVQTRIAFGGNLTAEIVCPVARPQMATARANVFENDPLYKDCNNEIISINDFLKRSSRIRTIASSNTATFSSRLINAEIVVCGGRGLGSKQGFNAAFELAELLGGTVGATRYAVDSGWIDYSYQIGQTGVTIRPKFYFSFGVSGAVEHIIGMRDADCIISINKDEFAPIFSYSDYKIVGDCREVLEQLIYAISIMKGRN